MLVNPQVPGFAMWFQIVVGPTTAAGAAAEAVAAVAGTATAVAGSRVCNDFFF